MLVYAPGWTLLASQFWSHNPSQRSSSWFFRGQKNENSPLKTQTASSDLKFWKFVISGQNGFLARILSRRYRLARTTSDPSRLIRPRPIDCDRVTEQSVKNYLDVAHFFVRASPKKSFSITHPLPDLVMLYTPKQDHRRIGIGIAGFSWPDPEGHFSRDKRWPNRNTKVFLGKASLFVLCIQRKRHPHPWRPAADWKVWH